MDAGKEIKDKKRHILVDTQSLLMHALAPTADVQDRDGGMWVIATLFGRYPFLLYVDGEYHGATLPGRPTPRLPAHRAGDRQRSDQAMAPASKAFIVPRKRWVPACARTERTFAR